MQDDETLRLARRAGLERYLADHPEQLRAALASASALRDRLPRDLSPAEEPAHVYRARANKEQPR
jgi:hypothetical protein